ncbi:uncharacterized protein TM35_000361530 [Trypanosoma theileri]|uniref:Uncharacterized protein n=1 Tax=Trypanosoma theileri TaxID=67003 RepID=A0A1X0NLF5_9TRYP|nr:uncharacterized protein TM35_000361530 [Trypanosoma theileri]ORC85293.1 hypothetical protein TM35_000361530 [Trypanosoma theileri]
MRSSPLLRQASPSSAAALGKGSRRVNTPTPSRLAGAHAAMLAMQHGRLFTPHAYLSESSSLSSSLSSSWTSSSTMAAAAAPSLRRKRRYEPHAWILQRYIERGAVDMDLLLFHPDAPSPVELLLRVMRHRTPCARLTVYALQAALRQPRLTSSAGAASFALQTVSSLLRRRCPHLYETQEVRVLLCQLLLAERLFSDAVEILQGMPDAWITPGLWVAAVEAAAEGKIAHSTLLWRLLTLAPPKTPTAGRVVQTGQRIPVHLRRGEFMTGIEGGKGKGMGHVTHQTMMGTAVNENSSNVDGSSSDSNSSTDYSINHSSHNGRGIRSNSISNGMDNDEDDDGNMNSNMSTSSNRSGSNNNNNSSSSIGSGVIISEFEVRPTSLLRLVQETGQLEWCKLSTLEVSYAQQHYSTLCDHRAWGMGTLYAKDVESSTEGIVYGLDEKLASRLMLRANVSFSGQASPLIALHILRRYLRTCHALQKQVISIEGTSNVNAADNLRKGSPTVQHSKDKHKNKHPLLPSSSSSSSSSDTLMHKGNESTLLKGSQVHPSPFLLFFKIVREARDVVGVNSSSNITEQQQQHVAVFGQPHPTTPSGLPMIHWGVVWHFFQRLNRECPSWYTIIPEEAGDLSRYVIDALCRGADPWMTLNVARAVSARHVVDGLDISLWLLHRLDASHHTEEAREVTRKVFRWLLVDVGIHLLPQLHHHLTPAARVLIRLGLYDELQHFYNAVLDNVYAFAEDFRTEFMHVMADLVCPSCSSLLPTQNVFVERSCPLCLTIIPPKNARELPSFQLSSEHINRLRERRKTLRLKDRQRLHERIYRWSKRGDDRSDTTLPLEMKTPELTGGTTISSSSSPTSSSFSSRPPLDASSVFKHVVLGDTKPLIPGVSVEKEIKFFLLEGDKDKNDSSMSNQMSNDIDSKKDSFDVHAAMEESSRRLQLQEAARQYALAQRGVSLSSARQLAALPSLISSTTHHMEFPRWKQRHQQLHPYQDGQQTLLLGHLRVDGPWTCVWCQEQNSEWSSRVQCSACGAETGPSAPWRHFAYSETGDVMVEIRGRIANAEERPVDAVVAAYLLMVYRRAFLLRAIPHDHERIDQLIRRLCTLHERVLAGYIYIRFVPPQRRCKGPTLFALAQLFGSTESACMSLSARELMQDEKFFETVFTPATCKVCFGLHAWKMCPIITRDFSTATRTSINMTTEEKQRAMLEQLRNAVGEAIQHGSENSRLVVEAYTTFVKSPHRELFAQVHCRDVNHLSILLSRYHQYRRAAFVLCHIPLHLRDDQAYLVMVHYFNVPVEEAQELLQKRSPLGVEDETHPNFVQVALTCCMCLDGRHASFECPRLTQWLNEVDAHNAMISTSSSSSNNISSTGSNALSDPAWEQQQARRLRAQVDGWTSAGPERLHAFYRFLLQHVDTFQEEILSESSIDVDDEKDFNSTTSTERKVIGSVGGTARGTTVRRPQRRMDVNDPIIYALNKTIIKLAEVGHEKGAYRLYARAPVSFISRLTTSSMLRMNRFSEESIRTLLNSSGSSSSSNNGRDTLNSSSSSSAAAVAAVDDARALGLSSEAARAAAVPLRGLCLLCFDRRHAYLDCPELAAQSSTAARLEYVAVHVGGIRCGADGVRAAAAYVYHTYNHGGLTGEWLRGSSTVGRALRLLAGRCFAAGLPAPGARVLRRLPPSTAPDAAAGLSNEALHAALWRAAGLPAGVIASRRLQLRAAYAAEGVTDEQTDPDTPRPTYSNRFLAQVSHILHDDLCRHCYQHGHTLATCGVFHAEVSFGRDYVAAYRMSMMSEQLDRDWQDAYLLKLADFFQTHRLFMPYHIVGVTNALNAIAAMWSFRGEPGIAMRHLLTIPPAYRRRQAFKHILHALHIPTAEISRVLANVYFSPDELLSSSSSSNKRRGDSSEGSSSTNTTNSTVSSNNNGNVSNSGGAVAQHLLMPKPAIRDVAMTSVFNHFPEALAALEKSEERMMAIRRRNATQKSITDNRGRNHLSIKDGSVNQTTFSTETSSSSSSSGNTPSPAIRVMQSGDILTLREDFDPILTELEMAVGMKLGSRHVLFTSAVDILSAAANKKDDSKEDDHASSSSSSSVPSTPPVTVTTTISESSQSSSSSSTQSIVKETSTAKNAEMQTRSSQPQVSDEDTIITVFTEESGRDERKKTSKRGNNSNTRSSSSSWSTEKRETSNDSPRRQQHGTQHQHHHHHYSQKPRYHERQHRQRNQEQQQQQHRRGQRSGGGNGRR